MNKDKLIEILSNPPKSLESCLDIISNIKYKTYGFGAFSLDYVFHDKKWRCGFRNPVNFKNPEIRESCPLEAVLKMFGFLLKIIK